MTALWVSRKKAKLALKMSLPVDYNNIALNIVALANGDEWVKPTSLEGSAGGSPGTCALKRSITSLDKIILEVITNLKELCGSDRTSIFLYIEIKHKYRFSTNYMTLAARQKSLQLILEGNNEKDLPKPKVNGTNTLTKSRVDGELFTIKGMIAQEAAEEKFAIAEAEEAAKEAKRGEAEAAQIFAKAAMKALKFKIYDHTW